MKISVIVADDHELILDGLTMMLKELPEIEFLGDASNGEQLLKMVRQLSPDIVLTDIRMPKVDGIEVARTLKKELPHIGVIGLSSYDEENLIIDMLRAGAKGFLLKTSHKTEILKAIKAVNKGESYYCRHTSMKIAEVVAERNKNPLKEEQEKFTEREMEVIKLVCLGLSSKEIGHELNIKTRTVERYKDGIMEKMGVHSSTAMVTYAISNGLYIPKKKRG